MTGGQDRVLIGRSEQADLVHGISSNYACINCCGNSFYDGWVTPGFSDFPGNQTQMMALQQDQNCYGQPYLPYAASASFNSFAPSICNSTFLGQTTGIAPGETSIQGAWTADSWFMGLNEQCEYTPAEVLRDALCNTLADPHHLLVVSDTTTDWCTGAGSPSLQRTITYQVVDQYGLPVSIPLSIGERFFALNDHTCGAGAPGPSGCGIKFNGIFTDTLMAGCTPAGGSCGYDVLNQIVYCRSLAVPRPLGSLNEQVHANQITVNGNSTSLQGTYIYP